MTTPARATDPILRCGLDVEVRGIDEEKRTATFVASTERAVQTWEGPEVLRMSGAKLKRFKKNPVILDSHDRFTTDAVIGKGEVEVKGRELHVTVTYATTPRAEQVWSLVKGGFLRAVSVGFMPNREKTKRLAPGEFDGKDEARVEGPALIVREWELLEISNVPIPADEDALRRSFYDSLPKEAPMELSNVMGERATATAPTGSPPAATAPTPKAPTQEELPQERAARIREATRREVLAITPRGLEAVAESAVLEGLDFEGARKRLLEAHAKRNAPLGTPEPAAAPASGSAEPKDHKDLVTAGRRAFFGEE